MHPERIEDLFQHEFVNGQLVRIYPKKEEPNDRIEKDKSRISNWDKK